VVVVVVVVGGKGSGGGGCGGGGISSSSGSGSGSGSKYRSSLFGHGVKEPKDVLELQHQEETKGAASDQGIRISSTTRKKTATTTTTTPSSSSSSSGKMIQEVKDTTTTTADASNSTTTSTTTTTTTTDATKNASAITANTTTTTPKVKAVPSQESIPLPPPPPPPSHPTPTTTTTPAATTTTTTTRKPAIAMRIPRQPPKTMYEMETTWRSLRRDITKFANYLKLFKSTTFAKVFKESSNPEVVSDVFRAVREQLVEEGEVGVAKRVMEGMAGIGRFKMIVMMMGVEDKRRIQEVLEKLEGSDGPLHEKYTAVM